MQKYTCENCDHYGKGGVFKRNNKCKHCLIDTKDTNVKPSNFKEKEMLNGGI